MSTFIKMINDKYIIHKRHFLAFVINIIIIRLIIGGSHLVVIQKLIVIDKSKV